MWYHRAWELLEIFRMLLRLALAVLLVVGGRASAQEILGDVFAGKLINPEPGVWAWYQLTDRETGDKFFLRQAIVGVEKVKKKDGYWVETELVPQEGFASIFKMLLTGPASDPKNVHQLILKEGTNPPESVPVPEQGYTGSEGVRTLVGAEKVKLENGEEVDAQHYKVGAAGAEADVWLNDTVRPLGIVKMSSAEGELVLQRSGVGGKDGESVINSYLKEVNTKGKDADEVRVEVRVNGKKQKADEAAAPEAAEAPAREKKESPATPKPAKKSKNKE